MSTLETALRGAREKTNLSQRDFAEKVGLDQSRISRIENGTISPSENELERWFAAIRADDADRIRTWMRAPWSALSEVDVPPSCEHPSLASIAAAAVSIQELQQADVPEGLRPSVIRYMKELSATAASLKSLHYRATLVGSPAVGKSTAEAYGLDLLTPGGDTVLPTGGGGTTLCEVLIEQGEQWKIVIEPESPEETRRLVEDLCAVLQPKSDRPADERPIVATEVRAALLNMADLGPKTETGPDGQSVRREPVRELAEKEGDRLVSSLLLLLRLDQRTLTEMSWEEGMPGDPLVWMREKLRKINRGLHEGVSLPRRIRLILARPVLKDSPFAVTVADTRGVTDNVVRRPDLAVSMSDPRTVTMLCSSFLNAPDLYVRSLIQYAEEQEFPSWRTRTALLLLARSGEPAQVRYEDTDELVDNEGDGIRIKEAQARQQLSELKSEKTALTTYNARQDSSSRFREVVIGRIIAMRAEEERRIATLSVAARDLLVNARHHAAQKAREAVVRDILIMLDKVENLSTSGQPYDLMLQQVGLAHQRSVWAMTRRRGQWRSLSLDLHLSDGAALLARTASQNPLIELNGVLDLLSKKSELKEAHGLVQQIRDALNEARVNFIAQARNAMLVTVWSPMRIDMQLWADCEDEWGRGVGFRDRVVRRLEDWFGNHGKYIDDFNRHLQTAWEKDIVQTLRVLCGP